MKPARNIAVLLALGVSACAAAGAGGSSSAAYGSIVASVDRSEWGPPGSVTLDLSSGAYRLEPAADRGGRRAPSRLLPTAGTISPAELEAARAAWLAALAEGLADPACRNGVPPGRVTISNAAGPTMSLATDRATHVAPEEAGCWSAAARRLHDLVDARFGR